MSPVPRSAPFPLSPCSERNFRLGQNTDCAFFFGEIKSLDKEHAKRWKVRLPDWPFCSLLSSFVCVFVRLRFGRPTGITISWLFFLVGASTFLVPRAKESLAENNFSPIWSDRLGGVERRETVKTRNGTEALINDAFPCNCLSLGLGILSVSSNIPIHSPTSAASQQKSRQFIKSRKRLERNKMFHQRTWIENSLLETLKKVGNISFCLRVYLRAFENPFHFANVIDFHRDCLKREVLEIQTSTKSIIILCLPFFCCANLYTQTSKATTLSSSTGWMRDIRFLFRLHLDEAFSKERKKMFKF